MEVIARGSLDTTCTIDRPTNTTGTFMQDTESYTNIATLVPCSTAEPTAQEINEQGQSGIAGVQQQWEVRLPLGTNVLINDRLTLADGTVLRVQDVLLPMMTYRRLLFVMASRVS